MTILKIIGIVLLCLFLFLLILVSLVLFSPIKYYAQLVYENGKLTVKTKVTWIAIIRFYLEFIDKKLTYRLKLFFINMINSDRIRKKAASGKATGIKITDEEPVEESGDIVEAQEGIEERVQETEDKTEEKTMAADIKKTEQAKKRFKFSLLHPAELYGIITEKILAFRTKISRKSNELKKNIGKICEVITSPENREFVVFVFMQLKSVIKSILPKDGKVYVKLGLSDPAMTGQVLGAYSVINSVLDFNFILEPDFDNEVLEVQANVYGKIRVINLVIVAIKIYTNKTFRKFIRRK